MGEFHNDQTLTTADLAAASPAAANFVDRTRSTTGISEPDQPEEAASPVRDRAPSSTPSSNGVPNARDNQPVAAASAPTQPDTLFPQNELQSFRSQWDNVQTSFVDEPRKSVELADGLVANVVKRIAEQFATEREELEKQWDRGGDLDTEDLRQAIKRYRAFFDRLLAY